jgi:predicted transcriptional regulator
MSATKEEAKRLIDSLPEDATWDDFMYEFYVKKKLAQAMGEADRGEVVSHEEAKKELSSR